GRLIAAPAGAWLAVIGVGYPTCMSDRCAALAAIAFSRRAGIGAAVAIALAGCSHSKPARNLDLDAIHVSPDARLRTDVVGDGKFASTASFVLVDAENAAAEGAYVTLGGELRDAAGA